MARVFITGSTTGLGAGAASELLELGHEVVLHARNEERAASVGELASRATAIVVGDVASRVETRGVAEQVNAIGGVDAVIHNAAVYAEDARRASPEGHAHTFAVNVLAPYLLTAWIERPSRLVYLSSDMAASGDRSLRISIGPSGGGTASRRTATASSSSRRWPVSDDSDATTSGGYWFHQRRKAAPSAAVDSAFQDALLAKLVRLTDVCLA